MGTFFESLLGMKAEQSFFLEKSFSKQNPDGTFKTIADIVHYDGTDIPTSVKELDILHNGEETVRERKTVHPAQNLLKVDSEVILQNEERILKEIYPSFKSYLAECFSMLSFLDTAWNFDSFIFFKEERSFGGFKSIFVFDDYPDFIFHTFLRDDKLIRVSMIVRHPLGNHEVILYPEIYEKKVKSFLLAHSKYRIRSLL